MTTRRRTRGEGSITKTTAGNYRVRLDCGYVNGKRKQLSATCATLAEARIKLREFEKTTAETSNLAAGINMTLMGLCKLYVDTKLKNEEIRETTAYYYFKRMQALPPALLNTTLVKLKTKMFDDFIDSEKARGIKPRTTKTTVTILSSVLNYAVKTLKTLPSNPLQGSKRLARVNTKPDIEILSEDEHARIRGYLERAYLACYDTTNMEKPNSLGFMYIAYMIAYELGMRESEILGLRWSRINFKNNTLVVDNQRVLVAGKGSIDSTPKTPASIRVIVVSKGLINILAKYKTRFQHTEEDDYVFSRDVNGTKIWSRSRLIVSFKSTLAAVGITRHFTFHAIRHTNATRLIEKSNNDYKTVSERLGHSSVNITFDIYAHAIKRQHQLAATLMDCTQ